MREMRRRDRQLTREETWEVLSQGEYGTLCTVTPEGLPYGIPISYALDGERGALYFHGTSQDGQKTDNLKACNRACLSVVARTQVLPDRFSTRYWSANAFGPVSEVREDEEKRRGLRLLVGKYAPDFVEEGERYLERSLHEVRVLRMDVETATGKARRK